MQKKFQETKYPEDEDLMGSTDSRDKHEMKEDKELKDYCARLHRHMQKARKKSAKKENTEMNERKC